MFKSWNIDVDYLSSVNKMWNDDTGTKNCNSLDYVAFGNYWLHQAFDWSRDFSNLNQTLQYFPHISRLAKAKRGKKAS